MFGKLLMLVHLDTNYENKTENNLKSLYCSVTKNVSEVRNRKFCLTPNQSCMVRLLGKYFFIYITVPK